MTFLGALEELNLLLTSSPSVLTGRPRPQGTHGPPHHLLSGSARDQLQLTPILTSTGPAMAQLRQRPGLQAQLHPTVAPSCSAEVRMSLLARTQVSSLALRRSLALEVSGACPRLPPEVGRE